MKVKNLVELVLNNSHNMQQLKEFNLSGSSNNIIQNLNRSFPYAEEEVPIEIVKKPSWNIHTDQSGNFMKKTYRFSTNKHLIYFITEVIRESNENFHHPEILIKEDKVDIVLFTEQVNDVTEQDTKLSKIFDEIYNEIKSLY